MSVPHHDIVLEATGLEKRFGGRAGWFSRGAAPVRAVDGVSLAVRRGETLAIVGESGCGKSTLARLLLRLIEPSAGAVHYRGTDLATATPGELRKLRGDLQFVFQDPFSSLNPRMTVGTLIEEPIALHGSFGRAERRERVAGLLSKVGLRAEHADRYPHEFSGGQRQRIGIARALASGPVLLVGDEPVSALDVSVQAQIVNLLEALKDELGLTLIIISHDLAVVRHVADRVAVMYRGEIVELAGADALFGAPLHPYTRALIEAVPAAVPAAMSGAVPGAGSGAGSGVGSGVGSGAGSGAVPGSERAGDIGRPDRGAGTAGDDESPAADGAGCRFRRRCPRADALCEANAPALLPATEGRSVACHHWRDTPPVSRRADAASVRTVAAARRFELYRERSDRKPPGAAPVPPIKDSVA